MYQIMRPIKMLSLLHVIFLFSFQITAYRLGDAIETSLRIEKRSDDVLRSQMPLFGRKSSAVFSIDEDVHRLSFIFEDSLRPLPWVDRMSQKGEVLQELQITFVYNRSGEGVIYAITQEASYSANKDRDSFIVKYDWLEEAQVDIQAAILVMFLLAFLASITLLIGACHVILEETSPQNDSNVAYGESELTRIPKWD
jgi:hypothetical protein